MWYLQMCEVDLVGCVVGTGVVEEIVKEKDKSRLELGEPYSFIILFGRI